jgi:hypothetical protein
VGTDGGDDAAFFDFAQACAGHFEEADFERAAEAIFDATHNAVAVGAVTFEAQNDIDEVFEQARAGELTVFGDVTNEDDGDVGHLGEIDEFSAAAAELRDAAGSGGDVAAVDHLHGVDDEHARLDFAGLLDDASEVGVVEEEE